MSEQFYDGIDEQGQLRLGVWRWASRCPTCGKVVEERTGSMDVDALAPIDRTHQISVF